MPGVVQHGPAFHVCVVLQLVLSTGVFGSAERQKAGDFVTMKAQNGSVMCAASTPHYKTLVRSKLDCYRNCISIGCSCACGANYRMKEKLCEMYAVQSTDYQVDPDCTFYQPQNSELERSTGSCVDMSCGSGPAEVLIQRHVERASPSSHGFNCSWAEYKNGFFDTTGNFWIGNEKLHQATSVQNPPRKRLRVELTHHNGNKLTAMYSEMVVFSENERYSASFTFVRGSVGLGDALGYFDYNEFSTFDNDHSDDNCPAKCGGGFWNKQCDGTVSNINQSPLSICGGFSWGMLGINLIETNLYLLC